MKKGIVVFPLLSIALVSALVALSFWKTGCSISYRLNPDTVCRVLDEGDGKLLVEYFNADTNELRLYVQQNGNNVSIEHPYGRISNYSAKIDANEVKFDRSDSRYLIVNGEKFEIVKLQ